MQPVQSPKDINTEISSLWMLPSILSKPMASGYQPAHISLCVKICWLLWIQFRSFLAKTRAQIFFLWVAGKRDIVHTIVPICSPATKLEYACDPHPTSAFSSLWHRHILSMKVSHENILDLFSLSLFLDMEVVNDLFYLITGKELSHKDVSVHVQLGEKYIWYVIWILVWNSCSLELVKILIS